MELLLFSARVVSEHRKKSIWQLVGDLRSGASVHSGQCAIVLSGLRVGCCHRRAAIWYLFVLMGGSDSHFRLAATIKAWQNHVGGSSIYLSIFPSQQILGNNFETVIISNHILTSALWQVLALLEWAWDHFTVAGVSPFSWQSLMWLWFMRERENVFTTNLLSVIFSSIWLQFTHTWLHSSAA